MSAPGGRAEYTADFPPNPRQPPLPAIGPDVHYPGASHPFPCMADAIDLTKAKSFFEPRVTEYQSGGAQSWG